MKAKSMRVSHPFLGYIVCAVMLAAGSAAAAPATGQVVGDDTCRQCHEDVVAAFQNSRHGVKGDPRTPAAIHENATCEACHGPGALHAQEGDGSNIRVFNNRSDLSAQQRNDSCLACHTKGKTARWRNSSHDVRSVACTDCHGIHRDQGDQRSRANQNQSCLSCHPDIKPQLMRLSHHPLREEKMACSDCHNAHGTIADHLIEAPTVNQKCYECHAEQRGPHLWQHQPVVEDCLTCHTPHGASREFLLNARTPYLCQRCHSNVDHAGGLQARNNGQNDQPLYRALGNAGFYRGCLNCHSAVHGSNHPSGKSLLR